jgi:hypothetical protein
MHAFDRSNTLTRINDNTKATPAITNTHWSRRLDNPVTYLQLVLKNRLLGINDRSSLKYNMIVMQILDAAKRSIAEGKRIVL